MLSDRIERAIQLLREHEPSEGYDAPFSGGKDSCVVKHLLQRAGVTFVARYNNVTIDPPELVRFIKRYHPETIWNNSRFGNMMHRLATRKSLPPTRGMRWCCQEYKEIGGRGLVKVIGVRQEESRARRRWLEVSEDRFGDKVLCPIVYWSKEEVWEYIREFSVPYCELYDEGWNRLGCVGCPLSGPQQQQQEFARWPRYEAAWKRAIIKNWENLHDAIKRNGEPYYHAKFRSGEDLWQWWLTAKRPDYFRGDCQSMLLMTNEDVSDLEGEGREE